MADTIYRVCDLCGGVDDHPRHVLQGDAADVFAVEESLLPVVDENLENLIESKKISITDAMRVGRDFADTTSQDRHMDCCAAAGCPTGDCNRVVAASDGAKGDKLRSLIMKEK